jgi:hypothetical protein
MNTKLNLTKVEADVVALTVVFVYLVGEGKTTIHEQASLTASTPEAVTKVGNITLLFTLLPPRKSGTVGTGVSRLEATQPSYTANHQHPFTPNIKINLQAKNTHNPYHKTKNSYQYPAHLSTPASKTQHHTNYTKDHPQAVSENSCNLGWRDIVDGMRLRRCLGRKRCCRLGCRSLVWRRLCGGRGWDRGMLLCLGWGCGLVSDVFCV